MQGCRTEGYEGYKCKDARLKDTKDRGCRLVEMLRSLVAPTRGAGGFSNGWSKTSLDMNFDKFDREV